MATLLFSAVAIGTFSLMDGWSYYPLGSSQMPYTDYYYPVPPLTIWEAKVASLFPNPLLALRVLLLPLVVAYFFALRYAARAVSRGWIASLVALVLTLSLAALRLEPLAGWNTQTWILLTVGTVLLVAANHSKSRRGWALAGISGIALAGACLAKQTSLVPAISVLVLLPVILGRWGLSRGAWARSAVAFGTLALVGLLVLLVLALDGTLWAFTSAMSSSGGKALDPVLAASNLMNILSSLFLLSPYWLLVVWFVVACKQKSILDANPGLGLSLSALLLLGLGLLVAFLLGGPLLPNFSAYFAAGVILGTMLLARYSGGDMQEYQVPVAVLLGAAFVPVLMMGMALWRGDVLGFFASMWPLDGLLLFVGVSSLTLGLGALLFGWRKPFGWSVPAALIMRREDLKYGLPVFAAAIALSLGNLVNVLSSGGAPYLGWLALLVCVILAKVLEELSRRIRQQLAAHVAVALVAVAGVFYLASVVSNPYAWWGWKEPSLLSFPRSDPEANYISDVLLDPNVAAFYARVSASTTRAGALTGQHDPSIFTFPNIPATAAASFLTPYRGLRCWVQWYDVCPPEESAADLSEFMRRPANVVVWRDLVENETAIHEDIYRQGRSPLRDWQAFKDYEVVVGRWLLVDRLETAQESPASEAINVYTRLPVSQWSEFAKRDWLSRFGSLPLQ